MDHQKTTQHPPKQINSDISLEELYLYFISFLLFILFIKHIYTYTLNSCKLVTLTDDQVQNNDILKHYQQKKDVIHF